MSMKKSKPVLSAMIAAAVMLLAGCSTVNSSYLMKGYPDDPEKMVKRVRVVISVPDDKRNMAPLLENIAMDMLSLRTNYLIYGSAIAGKGYRESCSDIEGVILFTVTEYSVKKDNTAHIKMGCRLYRCTTGDTLWSAEGSARKSTDDPDLRAMTGIFREKYPETAPLFAAPLFIMVQDMVDIIPDPELSDEEIDLKIQLESERG